MLISSSSANSLLIEDAKSLNLVNTTGITLLSIVILVVCIFSFIPPGTGCGSPHVFFPTYLLKFKNVIPDFLSPSYVFYMLPPYNVFSSFYPLYNILSLSFFFITNTTLCFVLCFALSFFSFSFGFFDARCASLFGGGGVMAMCHDASFSSSHS